MRPGPKCPQGFSIRHRPGLVAGWLAAWQKGTSFTTLADEFNRTRVKNRISAGLIETTVLRAASDLAILDPSGVLRSDRILGSPRALRKIVYLMERRCVPLADIVNGRYGRHPHVGPVSRARIREAFAELREQRIERLPLPPAGAA